jgi:hypothetical protein
MVNVDAFKAHMKGLIKPKEGSPVEEASEPSEEAKAEGDEDGLSPGDQAMKAIKSGDAAALEEAIRRCVDTKY